MLSAHFDKIIQQRRSERSTRRRSSTTNFPTIDPREMKNFDVIKHAVEANIPESTLNSFRSFIENTNLLHGPENIIIQGISKSQCVHFLLFYMIKHSDRRLRTSALRDSWDLNCNFIETLLDHLGPAIDDFIRQNLTKRSNTALLEVARASTISPFS
jgi:hypothetical protein